MPNLTDVRFNTLRALGYAGSISDMLLAWLQSGPFGGAPAEAKTVPDAWKAALEAQAAPPTTPYHRNDWWFEYLGSQGYTGQLNDRELAYWLALFEATTGTAYNLGYDSGYS